VLLQSRTTGSKKWQREIMYTRKEYWSYGNDDEAPNNLLQQVHPSWRNEIDVCNFWHHAADMFTPV